MLKGKNIILGVTGGIAAYKAATLIRLLVKQGANVKVIMTPMAKEFITPLTLATLSKNPILVDFYNPENGDWNSHVDLGLWADAYIIAPATANTMGKMANAIVDNLLVTTYLSARCPVFIAPAMDLDMYKHQANEKNIETLKSFGNYIIEPQSGELASGLIGKGRMAEPEEIYLEVQSYFKNKSDFKGKKVLVTAGPTQEQIDPVRFIGNYSSGKMGYAIANEFANRGADVILVSGNTNLSIKHKNITKILAPSAQQMYDVCSECFVNADIAVLAAAVADYKVKNVASEKIKKDAETFTLELEKNVDIAKQLGQIKQENQITVGFALETENEQENAKLKLKKKNFDFIVLNSMKDKGAGFNTDTNKITIFDKKNNTKKFEIKTKTDVAKDIVDEVKQLINN